MLPAPCRIAFNMAYKVDDDMPLKHITAAADELFSNLDKAVL
jgi:hypothetical protein